MGELISITSASLGLKGRFLNVTTGQMSWERQVERKPEKGRQGIARGGKGKALKRTVMGERRRICKRSQMCEGM